MRGAAISGKAHMGAPECVSQDVKELYPAYVVILCLLMACPEVGKSDHDCPPYLVMSPEVVTHKP